MWLVLTVLDKTPLAEAGPAFGMVELDEEEVAAIAPLAMAVTVQV